MRRKETYCELCNEPITLRRSNARFHKNCYYEHVRQKLIKYRKSKKAKVNRNDKEDFRRYV